MASATDAVGQNPLAILFFRVHGLSDDYLHTYLTDVIKLKTDPEVTAVSHHRHPHHHVDRKEILPYRHQAQLSQPIPAADPTMLRETLHEVRSAGELSFALVSDHDELGAWGRTFPVPLVKASPIDAEGSTDSAVPAVYTGRCTLPVEKLRAYRRNGADTQKPLTCRLVIVKSTLLNSPPPAVEACPASCILAVEDARTHPREARLRPLVLPAQVDLSSAAITDTSAVEVLLQGEEAWEADVHLDEPPATHNGNGSNSHGDGVAREPDDVKPASPNARFTPTETQFPFLHCLARESPSAAKQQPALAGGSSDNAVQKGPLLSLTFFGSDPRRSYNREEWLATLPAALRATIEAEDAQQVSGSDAVTGSTGQQQQPVPRTVLFDVARVRPVPMTGSSWCETLLPTPAPLQKQREHAKRDQHETRSVKRPTSSGGPAFSATTTPPTSASTGRRAPQSTVSSVTSCYGSSDSEDGLPDKVRGWCVRPLVRVRPMTGPGLNGKRTQHLWNCVVDLSCLEDQALEVEVEVPLSLIPAALRPGVEVAAAQLSPHPLRRHSRPPRTASGSTVLVSSMFNQGTKGSMQTSIPCRLPTLSSSAVAAGGSSSSDNGGLHAQSQVWVFLHVQYLFIFPYAHDNSDLRVVRSAETYRQLTLPTLVGHRGLGKTYTRRDAKAGKSSMPKLAENSIESLNAAHRRGCAMVEFDVMLTLDRVPIIFHDPMLMLHAKERSTPSYAIDGIDTQVPNNDADVASIVDELSTQVTVGRLGSAQTAEPLSRLPQWHWQKLSSFVPIPVAIHALTKRQLDALVTESFSFGETSPPRLKIVLLQHWPQILRIYRNRSRLQCMRDHPLAMVSSDGGEFRGCADLLPGAGTSGTTGASGADTDATERGGKRAAGSGGDSGSPSVRRGSSATNLVSSTPTARYRDPREGVMPTLPMYKKQLFRGNHVLARQEDITNRIPALHELFLGTPPSLGMNIEIKYPFVPRWDANLFQQVDAFEVNGFVDAVLDVVFAYANEGRQIAFSSFEPDICLALAMKQSRYDVVFLSDTEEKSDLKDYRSFFVEGAIQFARTHHLAGISINASSLPLTHRTPSGDAGAATMTPALEVFDPEAVTMANRKDERRTGRAPLVHQLIRGKPGFSDVISDPTKASQLQKFYDWETGRNVVNAAHDRGLKVWTWGDTNSDLFFDFIQAVHMGVDAIITDNVPV